MYVQGASLKAAANPGYCGFLNSPIMGWGKETMAIQKDNSTLYGLLGYGAVGVIVLVFAIQSPGSAENNAAPTAASSPAPDPSSKSIAEPITEVQKIEAPVIDIPESDQSGTCKDFTDIIELINSHNYSNESFEKTKAYRDSGNNIRYMDNIIRQLNMQSVVLGCPTALLNESRYDLYYQGCKISRDGSLDQAAYYFFDVSTGMQRILYPNCRR